MPSNILRQITDKELHSSQSTTPETTPETTPPPDEILTEVAKPQERQPLKNQTRQITLSQSSEKSHRLHSKYMRIQYNI